MALMEQRPDLPQSSLPPPEPAAAQVPSAGAIARLVRSIRGLPPAQQWWGPGCAGMAGWFRAESAPTTDATARFQQIYSRVRRGEPVLPAEARRHVYLMVKGLFGDELFGYLSDNQARLERRGLETLEVPVDTEGPLADNIEVVRRALEDAAFFGRSVVIVGHSKGAVESVSALALYPELHPGAIWGLTRRE
jgi:triacylglycerol lipase